MSAKRPRKCFLILVSLDSRTSQLPPRNYFARFIINQDDFPMPAILNKPRHKWIERSILRKGSFDAIDHLDPIVPEFNTEDASSSLARWHFDHSFAQASVLTGDSHSAT